MIKFSELDELEISKVPDKKPLRAAMIVYLIAQELRA